jgi:PPOX class probable F420-dependent enzyme
MAELSDKVTKLFQGPNYLFVATLNQDGSPQVTPVWTSLESGRISFNTVVGSAKERNLRRDPRIAMSITAREDPWDKADIRGRAVDFITGDEADSHLDDLSEKYIGQRPYPWRRAGTERIQIVIEADRVYE